MKRQYAVVAVIGLVIFAGMYYVFGLWTAVGFAIGAIFSSVAGIIGMNIAVRTNIRVAQAARRGLSAAFSLAFNGGSLTRIMVFGVALFFFSGFFFFFCKFFPLHHPPSNLLFFLISLF